MARFPEVTDVAFASPFKQIINFKTLISTFDGLGKEKRRQKWLFPKRDLVVQYENITKEDAETLWQFYLERKGSYESFNFFVPEPKGEYSSYVSEYVGTGDGSTTTFNLPCKTSSNRTVYVGDATMTEGTDYTFTATGGTDGADIIHFSTAPASGEHITIDFTGILKVRVRFAEDYMDFDTFYDAAITTGLKFKGVLNQ